MAPIRITIKAFFGSAEVWIPSEVDASCCETVVGMTVAVGVPDWGRLAVVGEMAMGLMLAVAFTDVELCGAVMAGVWRDVDVDGAIGFMLAVLGASLDVELK